MTERAEIKKALKAAFKSPFGSIFRADLSKTHFARQLERYAELYTCSIRNLDEICLNRKEFYFYDIIWINCKPALKWRFKDF